MSSILLKLDSSTLSSQTSQDFTITFSPNILLDNNQWELALIKLNCWYSWYNISSTNNNNKFVYTFNSGDDWNTITIPDGQYTVESLNDYIHFIMKDDGYSTVDDVGDDVYYINLIPNYSNGKVEIEITDVNFQVDFTVANSVNTILGFEAILVDESMEGSVIADITNGINSLMVHCDLVNGSSYENSVVSDILYAFTPQTSPSSNINVEPISKIYLQINKNRIPSIRMYITDQQNRLIDFNDEPVTYLVELRKIK